MRKLVCFSLAILVLFCFTACNLNLDLENLANESESAAITEEMLDILAEKRVDDAKALFHPQVDEEIDTAITQMCDFLDGRKAESVEIISININNSTGTAEGRDKSRFRTVCGLMMERLFMQARFICLIRTETALSVSN